MWQYYQSLNPGQVQVLGIDLYNGTSSQLTSFKSQTGATYPLFMNGALATGGNLYTPYGQFDNYVVINKQGIIRYHAYNLWPHGNRYHLNEIRACVDSLVTSTLGVGDAEGPFGLAIRSFPNPAAGETTVELVVPSGPVPARVTVHDLAGRIVATLLDGPVAAGTLRLRWNGRGASGEPLAPGVYLMHAVAGGRAADRRIVRIR